MAGIYDTPRSLADPDPIVGEGSYRPTNKPNRRNYTDTVTDRSFVDNALALQEYLNLVDSGMTGGVRPGMNRGELEKNATISEHEREEAAKRRGFYNPATGEFETKWSEGGAGQGMNMYEMLMLMFSMQPVYEIPQEVFDILNLSTQTAGALADLYSQQREDVLGRLDVEGLRALDILGQSKVDQISEADRMEKQMLGAYGTGMDEAIGTLGRSRADQLRETGLMEKQMLGAYEEGGQASLDILSQRAYGGLPGETQYLENLQSGTASAVENLMRFGGRGSQGAIADIYTGQQEQMRGLAGERAQFQSDAMLGLADARMQYGAGRADIYGKMGDTRLGIMERMDTGIAGVQERRGQGMASIYETGSQTRIGISSNMDQVLANARMGLSDQYAQHYQSTTGALGGAIDRGGQLITQALGNVSDKRDLAWNLNVYEPYANKRNFIIEEYRRNDPSEWYTNFISQLTAGTYDLQLAGVAGQTAGADQIAGSISQGMGNYFTGQYLDKWSG